MQKSEVVHELRDVAVQDAIKSRADARAHPVGSCWPERTLYRKQCYKPCSVTRHGEDEVVPRFHELAFDVESELFLVPVLREQNL